jgi:hypothetical protein
MGKLTVHRNDLERAEEERLRGLRGRSL